MMYRVPGRVASDKIRRAMARRYRPRVVQQKSDVGTLSVCFDDFPRTAWTEGGRILRDHGVRATFYVCGRLCGSIWDGQAMFEAHDLPAIHEEGHELACQTFQHVSCLRVGRSELESSVSDNQRFVREHVGDVRLRSFAYPYGDASVTSKRFLVGRFACVRGVDAGINAGTLDIGQLKAVGLEVGKRPFEAVHELVMRAAERRAWIVVYTHDVQPSPTHFGCRPDDLDRLLRVAKAAGLRILPVDSALQAVTSAGP
jgi:peptidoglycan/xylan/chitin deacetylase (PgdA/CDA1 family)